MGKFLAAASLLLGGLAFAEPAQILIIRHAEKPASGSHLSARGYRRAAALVEFFLSDAKVTKHGPPAAIYAMAPDHADGSLRAIETVTPLAHKLGLKIVDEFTRDELAELARAIYRRRDLNGKTVLICWEHKVIPNMVEELGWKGGPDKWHGETFDRVWGLSLRDGRVTSFQNIAQHLLSGDSLR